MSLLRRSALAPLILCATSSLQGQAQGQKLAPGWTSTSGAAFQISVDTTVGATGTSSGHIKVTGGNGGSFNQKVKPREFAGKRVRLTAQLKTIAVIGTGPKGAALWMRIDGDRGTIVIDNMADRPIVGTTEWTKREIVLDVPEKGVIGISFGLLLNAPGEAWLDDVAIEVVGDDVPVTRRPPPAMPPIPEDMMAQVRQQYSSASSQVVNPGFEVRK